LKTIHKSRICLAIIQVRHRDLQESGKTKTERRKDRHWTHGLRDQDAGDAIFFAQAGFDFFFNDMEHSSFTMETVSDMKDSALLASTATGYES
jgi:hypothetical protein